MSIIDKLLEVANENKDTIAFIEDKNYKAIKYTYADLVNRAKNLAVFFKEKGIKRGDYVTVFITMSIDLYVSLIALWYIGAIPVFFDVSAGKDHVNKCSEIIKPCAVLGTRLTLFYSRMFSALKKSKKICIGDCKLKSQSIDNEKGLEEEGALITFTSGSTGRPKTVMRTHDFLLNQYEVIKSTMKYEKGQIDLGILPVFTLANLAAGITTVIPNSSMKNMLNINAKNIVEQVERYNITTMTISPAVLKQIADFAFNNGYSMKSLERVYVGGGPVLPNMLKNLSESVEKNIVYGSSEAEPISELKWGDMLKLSDEMLKGRGLPVGRIVEGVSLKIINRKLGVLENIESLEQFEDKVGEIIVSGKNVLKGYHGGYGDKENKVKVNDVVWHRTGDCGYLDENNCLWLVGGKKSIIETEKGEVYPFVIQCVINMKYNITKSAVLEIDNKVVLVLEKNNSNPKDIFEYVSKFGIQDIIFVDKIPMDKRHGAKVDYNLLRKRCLKWVNTGIKSLNA